MCAGKWKATIAASNQHGEGPESELTSEFTVGVTSKPVIDAVQVWHGRGSLCAQTMARSRVALGTPCIGHGGARGRAQSSRSDPSLQGGPDGLVLSVYRPGDISAKDARYLTYLVQVRLVGWGNC